FGLYSEICSLTQISGETNLERSCLQ
ncbi:hypothetical protein CP082626L3_0369B, partial [Chlamydia psittaci 08-2626_L3]